MIGLLTAVHVLIGVVLVLAVLLQSARGADLAGAFGGMGSQTAFGPRGTATFLSKATVVLAISFMLTSVSLAILSNRIRGTGGGSVLSGEPGAPKPPASPGQPATPPPGSQPIPGIPGGAVQVQPVPVTPPAAGPATPGQPPVQVPTQTAPAPAPAQPPANPPAPAPPQ